MATLDGHVETPSEVIASLSADPAVAAAADLIVQVHPADPGQDATLESVGRRSPGMIAVPVTCPAPVQLRSPVRRSPRGGIVTIRSAPPDTGGFGPVEPLLDHLVYAVPDLDAATRAFAAATGVDPAEGGRHLGRGTRNVLVGFGETSYLEIIGPDPEHPADAGVATPFGLDALDRPRLVTWAVHPVDLEAAAAASAAAGADLGPVLPMSRRTPAGVLLEWRLASTHPAPLSGVAPFLIDWGSTAHPAPALPRLELRGLRATHPDPDAVSAVLEALGVRLGVGRGSPGLAALLETPRGVVVLA